MEADLGVEPSQLASRAGAPTWAIRLGYGRGRGCRHLSFGFRDRSPRWRSPHQFDALLLADRQEALDVLTSVHDRLPPLNWCRQDGIEPPSVPYKGAVLPLNDAGAGVTYRYRSDRRPSHSRPGSPAPSRHRRYTREGSALAGASDGPPPVARRHPPAIWSAAWDLNPESPVLQTGASPLARGTYWHPR